MTTIMILTKFRFLRRGAPELKKMRCRAGFGSELHSDCFAEDGGVGSWEGELKSGVAIVACAHHESGDFATDLSIFNEPAF
jgi:hypothetical protein